MAGKHILVIDQGTTNTKVLLVNEAGHVVGRAARPLSIRYPQPGWVEQDATELWRSVELAIQDCLAAQPDVTLSAIAVTNQRESTVAWERATGRPVGPCVVWQCRRSAALCDQLRTQGHEQMVLQRTGLTIDPMFSAGKMRWLLEHVAHGERRAVQGELCLGTVDAWLLWNLTGGTVFACDASNASRTQLMSLERLAWDDELLRLYGIPAAALPAIRPSSGVCGESRRVGLLPEGVPIASLIGDSHASLFGHGGFWPGSIKATYGTGSSLMTPMPLPVISRCGLSTTVAWLRHRPTYALEGNILATGAAVQWLQELLGLADAVRIEELARQVEDTGGVYVVPAFSGLGAPHWSSAARGLVCGLTRGTTAAHLARATLEAIAFQVRDVFDAMRREAGAPLNVLLADGGASRNDLLMQMQADILGRPVARSASADVAAIGAAYLAGLAVGLWKSERELAQCASRHDRFEPALSTERREESYRGWQEAVRKAIVSS